MADRGARKIAHLLSTPNPTLRKRAAAARKTIAQMGGPPGSSPPSTNSISDLQRFYRRLARRIRATHTGSRRAKRDVLAALMRLDSGFSSLAAAISAGKNGDAKAEFDAAHRQIHRANHDLRRAVKRLA